LNDQIHANNWALEQVRERRFLISRYDEWIFDEISPYIGQRVLEVGCGLGNLIQHLIDRTLIVGIDPDHKSIAHLRQTYAGQKHVQFHSLDVCDSQVLKLSNLNFDTVVSLNVFEHIDNDSLALRHLRNLLDPDGYLVLIVPAHSWLYGTMDRSIGHYRRYDRKMMRQRLNQAGFEPLDQKYLNVPGILGWFLYGRILRRQVPPKEQLRLFNRLVPLFRKVEQHIPMPFGLSLLTVAQ
jgi:SAM-dependent methyltransferase